MEGASEAPGAVPAAAEPYIDASAGMTAAAAGLPVLVEAA
jgi:hypothetical protein